MPSKWLTWQPGSVGFVGSLMRGNSIIQSDRVAESVTSSPSTPSIMENAHRNLPTKPTKPLPPDSAYSELVSQAMQQIEQVCPPGALQWARKVHPILTDKIDVELFTRLDDLWNHHAPLLDCEAALKELVNIHAEVGRLYSEQRTTENGERKP